MSSMIIGAVAGAVLTALAAPYLARLTVSVRDKGDRAWWRGRPVTSRRVAATAAVGLVLGGLAGAAGRWSAVLPAYVALALFGTVLTVVDLESHILPNRIVFPLLGAGAVLFAVAALVRADGTALLRALEGGAAVFAVLFLLALAAPRSFGFGDVKLGGILGGYLGWSGWTYVVYGVFGGFVVGAGIALALLATRRATLRTHIPFGPSLLVGALAVVAFDLAP